MLNTNKFYIIIAALIVSMELVFFSLSNRFYIDTTTKLKVDRLSGKTYKLYDAGWEEIKNNQTSSSTKQNPQNKPNTDEYVKNLELLKNTNTAYNDFKKYYSDVLAEYEKDPLFYKDFFGGENIPSYKNYEKYSPLLSPTYIAESISQHNIKTPDEFIDYTINYYKNK